MKIIEIVLVAALLVISVLLYIKVDSLESKVNVLYFTEAGHLKITKEH